MSRIGTLAKKYTLLTHRWMGVFFCVLFAVWFVSGIVMMYWDYPGVGAAERMAHEEVLDPARIRVSPQQAWVSLDIGGEPDQARLGSYDGRPAYFFRLGRGESIVYADNGRTQDAFPREMTRRIAATWTGQPAASAQLELNTEEDQWTVSQNFRPLRPLDKYTWPDGAEVYVSEANGQVVQSTTRAKRLGAWFGAIPHWLYFTPLRRNQPLWIRVVIWSSGIGTIMALIGLVAGLVMYSPSKRYRFPSGRSSIAYAGQKRWHMILGLVFGVVTVTWAFSGMMSLDPFPAASRGAGRVLRRSRGGAVRLEAFEARDPKEALRLLTPEIKVRELDLTQFDGEPIYLAFESPHATRIVPLHGAPMAAFDQDRIVKAFASGLRPAKIAEVRLVTEYEAYYLDRHHERPLPVVFIRLDDRERSMAYIDPKTGRVVEAYNERGRLNRWLYHGLHSIDLPWLYRYRPAWDIFVLTLMLGGTALCVTSVVIGWRRLDRKLKSWWRKPAGAAAGRRPSVPIPVARLDCLYAGYISRFLPGSWVLSRRRPAGLLPLQGKSGKTH